MHSHLNSKMEILTVFSILNSLFLPKMKISAVFSILNSFFLLKMEILTLFSILNSLFILKMEILTVFSILNNKKSGKLRITFDSLPRFFIFICTSTPALNFYFCIYNNPVNELLFSVCLYMISKTSCFSSYKNLWSFLNLTPLFFSFWITVAPIPPSFFSSFSV